VHTHKVKEKEIKNMEKMSFDVFTKAVVEKIREYLPESFANASVELQTVVKNNDLKLTGLTIRSAESNICPTIYLEQFFEKYQAGEDMNEVLETIADIRLRNELKETFDVGQITDFDRVRGKIVPRLIGKEWNRELLAIRPHKIIADLAVTYHILMGHDFSGIASAPITNALMESWGVDVDTLHDLAIQNMPKLLPSTFQTMSSVLASMMGADSEELLSAMPPADEAMFILSNEQKVNGAAALLDKEIMKTVIERIGKEFFVLPSSIHECIIVPATADMDVSTLVSMVRDVNQSQVAPDERLSDSVYIYTEDGGLRLAC